MSQLYIGYDEKRQVYKICRYLNGNGKSRWEVIEELEPKRKEFKVNTFMCDLDGNTTSVTAEWYLELGAAGRMRRMLPIDMTDTSDLGLLEKKYILRGVYAVQCYVSGKCGEKELLEELYRTFKGWAEVNRDFEQIISNEPESKQDSLKQVFGEQNMSYFEGMKRAITQLPGSTAEKIMRMMELSEYELSSEAEN